MKKVYLETFGCQMNVSDSERVSSVLASGGYEMTDSEAAADVVLFNTCSIREKAEQKLYTRIGQVGNSSEVKPKIGLMGCVAQLEGETLFAKNKGIDFVLGTKAVGRAARVIDDVFEGNTEVFDLGDREADYDWTVAAAQRSSAHIAFVPIIEGCNKFCTYCIVPFSRGREKSVAADVIISQVLKLKNEGVREIHLIGQNVNSYRPKAETGLEDFKGATAFSRLLRAVAATGIDRVKFTTSFPRDFHPDIVDAIDEHYNLCNWVHLPVQSGSDKVLKMMRRGHTIKSYLERIDRIKKSPREIALSTDIIVGFPGETEEDFAETLKMAEYCEFDSAYFFKYSPRSGTPASDLADTVSESEKTSRFLRLEEVVKRKQINIFSQYIGKTLEVLVEKKSTKNERHLSGHSTCHKVVNFEGSEKLVGRLVNIKITESKVNTLFGKLI